MDRGPRQGHTDRPELRDPHTPPSRQLQGAASSPNPPPTRPPGSSAPRPLTGLRHRQPGTPGKLSGPHCPAIHANLAAHGRCLLSSLWPGACPAYLGTCGSSHALRNLQASLPSCRRGSEAWTPSSTCPRPRTGQRRGNGGPRLPGQKARGVREASGVSRGDGQGAKWDPPSHRG